MREVDDTGLHHDNCALLGYYALSNGNFLPTFQNNLSVPSSGFKNHAWLRSCSLSGFGSSRVISCSFLQVSSYKLGLTQPNSNQLSQFVKKFNFFWITLDRFKCNICVTCGMFNMYNQWHRQVAGKNSQRNSVHFLRLADVSRG